MVSTSRQLHGNSTEHPSLDSGTWHQPEVGSSQAVPGQLQFSESGFPLPSLGPSTSLMPRMVGFHTPASWLLYQPPSPSGPRRRLLCAHQDPEGQEP